MASTGRSESPVQSSTFRHSAWTLHDSREEGQPREAELVSSTWRLEKFGKFMKIAPKLEEYVEGLTDGGNLLQLASICQKVPSMMGHSRSKSEERSSQVRAILVDVLCMHPVTVPQVSINFSTISQQSRAIS
ncbi:hypothetical protein H113_02026 [Trichophyton rubrum MR1459]|uniref:Uncharacterized protein n=2 Tax=Trichophyton TaxID=5550 RepID=A0A022WBB4_TRIRU|nr:hypothetical protein H100_02020 [Trichophyton rubrum MR850]EZF44722.1 hypothetical protein H102_02017 [Trichophyton rubrum CBS 100081]EZF55393.1 hypothetical protein H103_02028 [Trichophyton rubrum CBS 288.86]EZF66011.1 hypothetical protein H104_02004 [Trichophyton rubrum CBS 289.86]EZF76614.1 hypothetical protein H105_02035 [Trichophyton soudanense CBS 452.61]EZF98033.1 hypothetical protein H113_02026 [Trichophyton rubrum MR1459]EZG08969.1 hypothetical protein H106_01883 [Trichophyton rub